MGSGSKQSSPCWAHSRITGFTALHGGHFPSSCVYLQWMYSVTSEWTYVVPGLWGENVHSEEGQGSKMILHSEDLKDIRVVISAIPPPNSPVGLTGNWREPGSCKLSRQAAPLQSLCRL